MVGGVKKIVENEFNLCCKRGHPMIYENSIFPAYVPEKKQNNNPVMYYNKNLFAIIFISSL